MVVFHKIILFKDILPLCRKFSKVILRNATTEIYSMSLKIQLSGNSDILCTRWKELEKLIG